MLSAVFAERWVEEDPKEILQSVYECIDRTVEKLTQLNINIGNIKGVCVCVWVFGCFSTDYRKVEPNPLCSLHSYWSDQSERDDVGVGQTDWRTSLQRHW